MKQTTSAGLAYSQKQKKTRRENFLTEMDQVIPWADLCAWIEPHYPKPTQDPRWPRTAAADDQASSLLPAEGPGAEEALYDSETMRRFGGIELGEDAVPDESTILQFRGLLERHNLTAAIFETISRYLPDRGLLLRQGTLVDATIIHAPSSTKN